MLLAWLFSIALAADLPAEEASAEAPDDDWWLDTEEILEVTVIGDEERAVENVPGSASVITEEDLEQQKPLTSNEVLQTLPGVHVNDEEGMGLRPNISIRGLDGNRSRKVLILEDGMPISLAPYGEPEMYYNPPVARMERIELVKGSGSILFGPQTIGGVINYITPTPPEEPEAEAELRGGSHGYGQAHLAAGGTAGDVGLHGSAFHQRYGGPRDLDLARTDLTGKALVRFSESHTLVAKLGWYDETSKATYLGLTQPQYETDPTFNFAEYDTFTVRRWGVGLTHGLVLGGRTSLITRVYGHRVARDWWRQDFDRADGGLDYERVIDGQGRDVTDQPSLWPEDGSGIYFRDSNGLRGRTFHVGGIEPRLTWEGPVGPTHHVVHAGARYHVEQAHEVRVDGDSALARSGDLRAEDDRLGQAVSAYALDRVGLFGEVLQLSPGVRVESLWTRQRLTTLDYTELDPDRVERNRYLAVLPGFGAALRASEPVTLFAGVHRGWAPPRTKDAVTTDGEPIELEAEHSWNYEVGARALHQRWLSAEAAVFLLDFSNQVIPPNEAGGAVSGDLVNGGSTTHAGVESAVRFDPTRALGYGVQVPLYLAYTFAHSTFDKGWSAALEGQRLPYAPTHTLTASIGLVHPQGLSGQVKVNHTGAQFSDKVETVEPTADGLVGRLDPRTLIDLQIGYEDDTTGLRGFVAAKNLLDQDYIASRTPRGIQPGPPRNIFFGIGWRN